MARARVLEAGSVYLERGQRVTVLTRWEVTRPAGPDPVFWLRPPRRNAPRNVAIERADGTRTVRSFRGLRKCEATR